MFESLSSESASVFGGRLVKRWRRWIVCQIQLTADIRLSFGRPE